MQTPTRRPPFTAPRAQSRGQAHGSERRTRARQRESRWYPDGKSTGKISDRWRSEETPLARR